MIGECYVEDNRTGHASVGPGGTVALPDEMEMSIVEWAEKMYIPKASSGQKAAPANIAAPDGYIRKTPVQGIRIPDDYRRRMIKRAIAIILGLAFAAAVIYVLIVYIVRL